MGEVADFKGTFYYILGEFKIYFWSFKIFSGRSSAHVLSEEWHLPA